MDFQEARGSKSKRKTEQKIKSVNSGNKSDEENAEKPKI